MGQLCKQAGLGNEPRTVIEEIKNPLLVDVVLATRSGAEIRLRCVSKSEPPWARLLQQLQMTPPERLQMKLKNVVKTF